MNSDIQYMRRALQLAEYGLGNVSPNPMVGCVVVYNDQIIGEGWHRHYGESHAEVIAIGDAEKRGNASFLPKSTVYVTLEPCSHIGKTPPCADLLVRKKVKRVVICNGDPNPLVSGRGIERLRNSGIEVACNVLGKEGSELNKRFFTSFNKKRPYVILKWAETADGFLGAADKTPVSISGSLSNMRVHKWRSEEDAILVGFNTALIDNPCLNVRHWEGRNPVRVVLDRNLLLPQTLHLFDRSQPTIVANYNMSTPLPSVPERYSDINPVACLQLNPGEDEISQLLFKLQERKIQSVFVEGGTTVINSFLKSGLWDEIRRCQGTKVIGTGVGAPVPQGILTGSEKVQDDLWTYYRKPEC